MPDASHITYDCLAAISAVGEFMLEHNEVYKSSLIEMIAMFKSISVSSDFDVRATLIDDLISTVRQTVGEYQSMHNRFLRHSRRRLVHMVTACSDVAVGGPTRIRVIREMVYKFHAKITRLLEKLLLHVSSDKNATTNPVMMGLMRKVSATMRSINKSMVRYLHAYNTMNFMWVTVWDASFFVVLFVKLARVALVYMGTRVARDWFDKHESRRATDDASAQLSLSWFVAYVAVMLAVVDACIVVILYGVSALLVSLGTVGFNSPFMDAWYSVLKDCLASDVASVVICLLIARVFESKRYLRLREDRAVSFDSFFRILNRVLLVNTLVPYFLVT